jgi:hypothetical protein
MMNYVRVIAIIAAISALSILWLLPKTGGDAVMALFVGWTALLPPLVALKAAVDPGASSRRR